MTHVTTEPDQEQPTEGRHVPEQPRTLGVQQLLALNKAAIEITSELDLDNLLQRIVDASRELIGCKYAALGVLGENGYIERFPISGMSETEREKIGEPPRGHGLLGVMMRTGHSLRVPDISKDPRRTGFPAHHPRVKSLLGVPIFVQGKLVGDLYLSEKIGADEFTEEDEWLVQLLATHAATALTNARLHATNVAAFESLRNLQDAVQQIASHLELEPLTEELLRYGSQITGAQVAWVGLLQADDRSVLPVSYFGVEALRERVMGVRIDTQDPVMGGGPSGRALRTRMLQVVHDIRADDTFEPWRDIVEAGELRSAVAVPLIYHARAVGVLSLYSRQTGAFDDLDLALLRVMADHAAVALQNAIHYQQVSHERARSQALLQVTQAINRSVQLDEVIPMIVQSAMDLLQAVGAAIYLLEEPASEKGALERLGERPYVAARYAVGLHITPNREIIQLPMERSVAGRAIRTGTTQVVEDTRKESSMTFPVLAGGRTLRALVVVPLWASGEMLGVLSTYFDQPRAFDAEAVQLLEAFGTQAGVALQNARLYAEAQRGREAAQLEQERLLELQQMKDEFLSTAAHELRTPLTAIRMSAGLVHEQVKHMVEGAPDDGSVEVDERLVDLTGLMIEGSQRMHSLVNDLLDLTRLEQGRTSLNFEEIDMREVIAASVEATAPLFENKGQEVTVNTSEAHIMVRGDRERLEQVLINLLSNAHKYTPRGSKVQIRAFRSGDECLVTVRDNGPGVPENELESIFERFVRSSMHRNDRTASTGLGLPIARTIAEMHKGRLWAERAPGGGSIFTLGLPVAER